MRGLAATAFALVAISASTADASPSLTVSGTITLAGDHHYEKLIVPKGATILVRPYAPCKSTVCDDETGSLRVFADSIEIGGTIDASGAGYPGVDLGPSTHTGSGPHAGVASAAGGTGAGFLNPGGSAVTCAPSCVVGPPQMNGGGAWQELLGSSGGPAGVFDSSVPSAGGNGGGNIDLEASVVVLNGSVLARGSPGLLTVDGSTSGGGAGGVVRIVAGSLQGSSSGVVSVAGGDGVLATATMGGAQTCSGGGAGGFIVLRTSGSLPSLGYDVAGGKPGTCAADTASSIDGAVVREIGLDCLDLDHDGHFSAECGGDDCDDSDPSIYKGAFEACDGKDNDCNGVIDDVTADACAPGEVCVDGACAIADVVEPDPGAPPDHLAFEGGCGLAARGEAGSSGGLREPLAFALLLAAAALGLRARRR